MADRREQEERRRRRGVQVFLFAESVREPLATVDAFVWELAISDPFRKRAAGHPSDSRRSR